MTKRENSKNPLFFVFFLSLSFFLISCGSFHDMASLSTDPASTSPANGGPKDVSVEEKGVSSVEKCPDNASDPATAGEIFSDKELAATALDEPLGGGGPGEGEKLEEQETIDGALELINRSQEAWEKGELENALVLLDQAYAAILNVDGNPDIAWQKDDLRYMISKRILEIYASRNVVTTGYQSEIPHVVNADVEKEIKRFQKSERGTFQRAYERSGLYRPMILEKLKKAGLPEELSWLPLVESGFMVQALSSARALGLWQIIPSTGYKFGLKRDYWIDERMDVEKSTDAAIAYLKELHGIFGDWLTVLAAYNCGEGRVLRVISRQHTNYLDNFWDLYHQLPFETARYVPRFLAAIQIIEAPDTYGMALPNPKTSMDFEIVTVQRSLRLKDLADAGGLREEDLRLLNPQLRYGVTPDREYDLKIPSGSTERLLAVLDGIPAAKKPQATALVLHRVKRGENLSGIAGKYGASVASIVKTNHLSSRHMIREGKILKVPTRADLSGNERPAGDGKRGTASVKPSCYRVKKGDSLWNIARRHGVTVSQIKRLNGLSGDGLQIGQVLRLDGGRGAAAAGESGTVYTVRPGDSLFRIARTYRITVEDLLEMNGLSPDGRIYPGQEIRICR